MALRPTVYREFQLPAGEPIPENKRGLGPSAKLIDFKPSPVRPDEVIGRRVEKIISYAGTYGMGGPGFFALKLGGEWLVIAVWGAADWLIADGRAVGDTFYDNYGRSKPWMSEESDDLSPVLVGHSVAGIEVSTKKMKIAFDNGLTMSIEEDPTSRPLLEGSKELRTFHPDDDLRTGVFLSPTIELWID